MQENTYIEPSTVINISASGDIITNTPNNRNSKDNNNNINASIHAGLSPSLWGSPATTTTTTTTNNIDNKTLSINGRNSSITMNKTTNSINVNTIASKINNNNIFQEGSLMEKKVDDLGLYTWEPRYMLLNMVSKKKNNNNKRRTTRRRNTKQQHSNSSSNSMLNIWKLLPGSQTSSFNRPKTKANDFISIDTI